MAAGSISGAFDPLKKKLQPVTRQLQRGRSGVRNLLGAGHVYQDPKDIAAAKNKPWLTVTEQSVDVPKGYADQILRQHDPTGTGNPMGAKAPIVSAETIDAFDTELDQLFVSDVIGSAIPKKKPMTGTPQSFGSDKKHEVVFDMPGGSGYGDPTGRRKKRRPSLLEYGSTRGGY